MRSRILRRGGYPLGCRCSGVSSCYQEYSSFQNLRMLFVTSVNPDLGSPNALSRHLLGIGKEAEARKVIAQLNSVPEDDLLVVELMEELEFAIRAENEGGKATWLECFSTRNMLWKRTLNGMMLQFIQQLNGQNFYYYYGDTFFKSAGTTLNPYAIQTILGGVSVVGTVPALYLIETWGRRNVRLPP